MTKGKMDPTLSRSVALLRIPSSTLASWGASGHQKRVKAHSWEVARQVWQSSKQQSWWGRRQTQTEPWSSSHLYIYILDTGAGVGEGAGLSSGPRSTSGHPHTEAAGVLDRGALREGV